MTEFDAIIAGAGPGGLAAAKAAAERGARVLVVEQGNEIGSPIRTSGGSFIRELDGFGIPSHLYHPIHRCRFIGPGNAASFVYDEPVLCIMDVRGVYQFLAAQAIAAGATIRLATTAVKAIIESGTVTGLATKSQPMGEQTIRCSLLVDATGHRASLMKQAGVHAGFHRFGVGAEYDLYAPEYDESEAILIVGTQVAPAGYAWAFPWGNHRVRLGVGIIHPDSDAAPDRFLNGLLNDAGRFGINLTGAQPIELHHGLIPSDRAPSRFTANGIMCVGDAAGQASTFVGEGIRWAIEAGNMAGATIGEAVEHCDFSAHFLARYEDRWNAKFGTSLRIAYEINQRISRWNDEGWRTGIEALQLLTPAEFVGALRSDFTPSWLLRLLWTHPSLMKYGLKSLIDRVA